MSDEQFGQGGPQQPWDAAPSGDAVPQQPFATVPGIVPGQEQAGVPGGPSAVPASPVFDGAPQAPTGAYQQYPAPQQPGEQASYAAAAPQGVPVDGFPPAGTPLQQASPDMPGVPGQPGAKKKNSAVIFGVVGAVVVVVLAIALVLWFAAGREGGGIAGASKPASADYLDANTKLSRISIARLNASTALTEILYSSSDEVPDSKVKRVKDRVSKLNKLNGEFTKLKAYQDSDVKKAFDKYSEQNKKYTDYVGDLVEVMPALVSAKDTCSGFYSSSDMGKLSDWLSECQSALEPISKTDVKSVKDYVTAANDYVKQVQSLVEQLQALGDVDSLEYGTDQYNQYRDLQRKFYDLPSVTDIDTEFSQTLDDELKELDTKDALQEVTDVVSDKVADSHQ